MKEVEEIIKTRTLSMKLGGRGNEIKSLGFFNINKINKTPEKLKKKMFFKRKHQLPLSGMKQGISFQTCRHQMIIRESILHT